AVVVRTRAVSLSGAGVRRRSSQASPTPETAGEDGPHRKVMGRFRFWGPGAREATKVASWREEMQSRGSGGDRVVAGGACWFEQWMGAGSRREANEDRCMRTGEQVSDRPDNRSPLPDGMESSTRKRTPHKRGETAPRSHMYPAVLKLAGRRCLVAGGGEIALRKASELVRCGARVRLVA